MKTETSIKAVKAIRNMQYKEMQETIFCRKHNMKLQEILHIEIERKLNQLAMELEDILQTGYVSSE